jgi:hypothetical protein
MAKNPFAKKSAKGFEQSKFDNDKGVKEGSKADMKRDAKELPKFMAAKKRK